MEFTLLCFFFSLNIKRYTLSRYLPILVLPFSFFCIYDYLTAPQPGFAFLPLVIECLFFLIVITYIFYEKMKFSIEEPIFVTSLFWIAVGFIVYFSGNFFLFLYSRSSYNDEAFKIQYGIIYSSVTILKNILLCIGVTRKKERVIKNINSSFDSHIDPFSPF